MPFWSKLRQQRGSDRIVGAYGESENEAQYQQGDAVVNPELRGRCYDQNEEIGAVHDPAPEKVCEVTEDQAPHEHANEGCRADYALPARGEAYLAR